MTYFRGAFLCLLLLWATTAVAGSYNFNFNNTLNSDQEDVVARNLVFTRYADLGGSTYSDFVREAPLFETDTDQTAVQLAWDDYLDFSPNLLEDIDTSRPFRFDLRFKAYTTDEITNASPCCPDHLKRILLTTSTDDPRDLGLSIYLDALGVSDNQEFVLFINVGDGRSFLTSDPSGASEGYRFTVGTVQEDQWYELTVVIDLQNVGKEKLAVTFDGAQYKFSLDDPNRLNTAALKQHFEGQLVGVPPFNVYAEFCERYGCNQLSLPEGMSAPQLFLGGFPALDPHNATIDVAIDRLSLDSPVPEASPEVLNAILTTFIAHIEGVALQPEDVLTEDYIAFTQGISSDWENIKTNALELISVYSAANTPLFDDDSQRSPASFSTEGKLVYFLEQWLLDNRFQGTFDPADTGIFFEDSERWPGPVSANAPRISAAVAVDATYQSDPAVLLNQQATVIRPTGYYAPPGEAVTLTLPVVAVGDNLKIRIGIHRADMESGGWTEFNRFPRISSLYDINQESVTIANPFGGVIYFEVSDGTNLGPIQVNIAGAVAIPMFSTLDLMGHSADPAVFHAEVDSWHVPWFELHGQHFSATLPMNEAKLYPDPAAVLQLLDDGFEDIRLMAGRPLAGTRPEWLAYDRFVTVYGTALTASYPIYPNQALGEQGVFLSEPRNFASPSRLMNPDFFDVSVDTASTRGTDRDIYVLFHEWGHVHNLPTLQFQEQESNVHLLASVFYNKTMGADIDTALQYSGFQFFDRDQAALDTMFSPNWQLGERLSEGEQIYGIWDNEVRYQTRSWARIVEIAGMYGWEAVGNIHRAFYERGQQLGAPVNYGLEDDDFIETASAALGLNLSPIFDFWGVPPSPAAKQRLQPLPVPDEFEARLLHYKSIAPITQADFEAIYATHSKLHRPDSEVMIRMNWYRENFDAAMSGVIRSRISDILISYYDFDSDGDGVRDLDDAFPSDPAAVLDSDGDGAPDVWNDGYQQSDSTTGLSLDAFPNDPNETLDSDGDGYGDNEEISEGTDPNNADDQPIQSGLPIWLLNEATKR